jgi:hypothetical protein
VQPCNRGDRAGGPVFEAKRGLLRSYLALIAPTEVRST